MSTAVGIDPGKSGYLCRLKSNEANGGWVVDGFLPMPFIETGKRIAEVDVAAVMNWLLADKMTPYVVLEDVGYMPKGAGKSGFAGGGFSDSILTGRVRELVGMLKMTPFIGGDHAMSYELVAPQKWHKELGISITKITGEKGPARKKRLKAAVVAWCGRRYPGVDLIPGKCKVPQDGMADALALAHVAATRVLGSGVT